jgi:hypothetical protein
MNTSTVLVTGNTYPVKDAIKSLGGRWDAAAKGWRAPADKAPQAQALVAGAPKSAPRATSYSSRRGGSYRGRWTGCSCGSREGNPRDSDCASCQHDY